MATIWSERLAAVRKEKEIPQKMAALDLGVSQALLSHYEKGIRECSPAFLAKAAVYYGVSADYLLGLAEEKRNTNAMFSPQEQPLDGDVTPQTVYRALAMLWREADARSPLLGSRVLRLYVLTICRMVCVLREKGAIRGVGEMYEPLYFGVAAHRELQALGKAAERLEEQPLDCPRCVKTMLDEARRQIRASVESLRLEE